MSRLSVIICTHNPKAEYLQRVLDGLAAQTLPMSQWELLLIDNANDPALAPQWNLAWHPRGRTIREDTLGLTPARLRGVRESAGDILVYVDDDNVLAPDYLQTVHELLHVHPRLGAIGAGALEPDFAAEPVPQFQPYLPLLALRSHAQAVWSHDPRDADCMPWGAGLCVKRPVALEYVQLVGQLDTHGLLDRRGQR